MAPRLTHESLTFAITFGALTSAFGALTSACGSASPPPGSTPANASTPSSVDDPAASSGSPDAAPSATPSDGTSTTAPAAPPRPGEPAHSRNLIATQMEGDLKKIGLDPNKLPRLDQLPLSQKKKVMPLLQKSLGMDSCLGCHVEGNFQTETRNMKVARGMWNHFVTPLRTEAGGAVFCDSCHSGEKLVLARPDRKAVETFMDQQYVQKLSRADKADMECSTCHGDAMELKIVQNLWKIPEG
ncbi:hypothetical protein [Chondromyces crocatus]|uniref:Uncharacterized protein n=1 Tax=Chondromyces crocatus TaxID=52 RepID=A0A0K1EJM6_CHOCO|nr:hypothetical protein [Chondromyces crocatus]AKT40892.1 uncharacterized protein CMC5_050490 [Chondromyces crocatus]